MTAIAWGVGIGLFLLGICIDNGITNIARALKEHYERIDRNHR